MIKTLRITSIIAAVLAAGFVVFSVIFGIRKDEQAEKVIQSAGVIEKFNKAKSRKSTESEGQASPLVKQAQSFTLYLNPPKPQPSPEDANSSGPGLPARPATVSAKFKLIGTSYYAQHPALSLALIDEPGKGFRWVRQASEVGRLVIEQVRDGSVVVRDDKRTFELVAEKPEKKSLLKTPSSGKKDSSGKPPLAAVLEPEAKDTKLVAVAANVEPQVGLEGEEFDKITRQMEAVQADVESGKLDAEEGAKRIETLMAELASRAEAVNVSTEEAQKLDSLGQQLKSDQSSRISAEPDTPQKLIPNKPKNIGQGKSQVPNPRQGRTRAIQRRGKSSVQSDPNRSDRSGSAEQE